MDHIANTAPPAASFGSGSAERCPLCGELNQCGARDGTAADHRCWCTSAEIPDALLRRVPAEFQRRACICANCVTAFHRERTDRTLGLGAGDFYFERGLMVLTAAYLQRRGYCCRNNCRHCPYGKGRA